MFALIVLAPALSFGTGLPSASVILDSWQKSVDDLASIDSYHVRGTYAGSSVLMPRGRQQIGSWDAVKEGTKYRWDFRIPEAERRVLAYDGRQWRNMTDLHRTPGGDVRGGVFDRPARIMGGEPRKVYEDLSPVYPFALEQIVAMPLRIPSARSMPAEYRARLNRIRVTAVDSARGIYKMSLADPRGQAPDFLPQEVWVRSFSGRFVPMRLTRVSPPVSGLRNVQTTSLDHYRNVSGIPVPAEIDAEMFSVEGKAGSAKRWIGSIRKKYGIDHVNRAIDSALFNIDFPRGSLVYEQSKGRATAIGQSVSPMLAPSKSSVSRSTALVIGGFVVALGSWLSYSIYRRRRFGNSS